MTELNFAERRTFGKTGLSIGRIALGSSYGLDSAGVEYAYDRGVNLFFWGALRRNAFGKGVRNLAQRQREKIVIAVQSYSRMASLIPLSTYNALRYLKTDYVDLLCLGWWNKVPPERFIAAGRKLIDSGKVRHLMISSHDRPTFEKMLEKYSDISAIMLRYNAAHVGAEKEVFPLLGDTNPGVLGFTATRWSSLIKAENVPPGERVPRASDCYRFVLSHPNVHVSLAGPKDRSEVDEALSALERGPLTPEEQAWMRRVGQVVRQKSKPPAPVIHGAEA